MDTTVILAQPRVSRLRAAAVYVDRRGSRGLPRAAADILDFQMPVWREPPPNPWFSVAGMMRKSDV